MTAKWKLETGRSVLDIALAVGRSLISLGRLTVLGKTVLIHFGQL